MNVLENAIIFATNAHEGQKRKKGDTPFILHPTEVASIIATMTQDNEVMAAGILHDTVEDAKVDINVIRDNFGEKIYRLVKSETENKYRDQPSADTWRRRKEESFQELRDGDRDVRILWLADKLANIRSFYRFMVETGEDPWSMTHQKDSAQQEWYYRTVQELVSDLSDTLAYKEYAYMLDRIFERKENNNG